MNQLLQKYPFISQILKGISQIMLQENAITGLFFLVGLFIGSWKAGLAALLATIAGTLLAKFAKFPENELNAGLYGFSPALTGVVMVFFFQSSAFVWFLVIIGGTLAAAIQRFFISRNFPAYTFPFIVTAWLFVFLLDEFTHTPSSELLSEVFEPTRLDSVFTLSRGYGQVIFQGSILAGILFFIGVMVNNPIAGLYGLGASMVGALLSKWYGQPEDMIRLGLFGFNAVLTAIVFAGKKKSDALWVVVGVLITILIDNLLRDSHILDRVGGEFTFPFVAGTWVTLLIQRVFRKDLTVRRGGL